MGLICLDFTLSDPWRDRKNLKFAARIRKKVGPPNRLLSFIFFCVTALEDRLDPQHQIGLGARFD